ncbi:MAG: Threonine synthase, partial [Streptococcus parasanguinis DORA_23_24]
SILYGHSLKVELRSPKPSVWVQFLLPVLIIMAGVVKWLTHQIVALACVGSIPITRLFINIIIGV